MIPDCSYVVSHLAGCPFMKSDLSTCKRRISFALIGDRFLPLEEHRLSYAP